MDTILNLGLNDEAVEGLAKKLPLLAPSIHTFEVNGTYTDCEAKRKVFMAIQKMVSAGKYYRIP